MLQADHTGHAPFQIAGGSGIGDAPQLRVVTPGCPSSEWSTEIIFAEIMGTIRRDHRCHSPRCSVLYAQVGEIPPSERSAEGGGGGGGSGSSDGGTLMMAIPVLLVAVRVAFVPLLVEGVLDNL